MKKLFFILGLFLGFSAFASTPVFDVEVQAGGASLSKDRGLELLFEIKAEGTTPWSNDVRYVIARVDADLIGRTDLPFIDIRLSLLGAETRVVDLDLMGYAGVTLLGLTVKRNISINNEMTYRVSLLGVRLGGATTVNDDIKLFANAAIDLIGFSASKRLSDGSNVGGYGSGGNIEVGAQFFGRLKVVLGQDLDAVSASPQDVYYRECGWIWDPYWETNYYRCWNVRTTIYNQSRVLSNTYLRLMADINSTFSVFGQLGYTAYLVNDSTGEFPSSSDSRFQFRFGVAARF